MYVVRVRDSVEERGTCGYKIRKLLQSWQLLFPPNLMSSSSSSRATRLQALVGDENGIMKHLYIPNVFAKPPVKPDRYRPPVAEPGEPKASIDPVAKAKKDDEFARYKEIMNNMKPKVTAMHGVQGLSRLNGVDVLGASHEDGTLLMGRHNGVVQRWSLPKTTRGGNESVGGTPLLTAKLQDFVMSDDRSNPEIKTRRQPGLNMVGICPGPSSGTVVTCSALGRLRVSNLNSDDTSTISSVSVGENIRRMRGFGTRPTIVAMGGREVDLKIYDLVQGDYSFRAKNVPHDWLDMRVPVWANDLQFLPGHSGSGGSTDATHQDMSSSNCPILGVATGYGQVRLYDSRASQRPVCDINVGDLTDGSERDGRRPLTSLCGSLDGRSVVCGNTAGLVCSVDLRTSKVVGMYKGFSGSCRSLVQHPDEPLLLSVSIDRHVRIHHTKTRRLLHRIYAKQRLTSLLLLGVGESGSGEPTGSGEEEESDEDEEMEEPDEMWDMLKGREKRDNGETERDESEGGGRLSGNKRSRGGGVKGDTDLGEGEEEDEEEEEEVGESPIGRKSKKRERSSSSSSSSTSSSSTSSSSTSSSSPLQPSHFTEEGRAMLKEQLASKDRPYGTCVITPLCEVEHMLNVHTEAKENLNATFKETDLFKLYQTDSDLATMEDTHPEVAKRMPSILALRDALYTPEFRSFVADITGVDDLTDRVDCSINAYGRGCHLMTHDDVIGTRRVSYIIYFADPDPAWEVKDGGLLELYPLAAEEESGEKQSSKKSSKKSSKRNMLTGIPSVGPTACLLPSFNTMAMFVVQPGRSYHAVQEVRTDKRPRLSIQGWFHGPTPLEGSDMASLSQIMTRGLRDKSLSQPLVEQRLTTTTSSSTKQEKLDLAYLRQYLNPLYLKESTIQQINEEFCENSSIQLGKFLREDLADRATKLMRSCDEVFFEETKRTESELLPRYEETFMKSSGDSSRNQWSVRGPPHMQRYCCMRENNEESSGEKTKSEKKKKKKSSKRKRKADELTSILSSVRKEILRSSAFGRLLKRMTSLNPKSVDVECRRFRPGMDYTLAHYGMLTRVSQLDATLCLVDDREDDMSDQVWQSGDVGGFQCYIVADEEEGTEAAEVYQAKSTEEEDQLLSIPPANNTLSLVLRDGGIMQFVKYVSAFAPGSRWDVAAIYDLEEDTDSSESSPASSASSASSSADDSD